MENGSAWRQTLLPKACKEAAMSHCEQYDLVVLGSGRARSFAWSLAAQGKRSAVIERRYVTGSCPSIACLPSKNLIHGAKVANYFRRGAEFGIGSGRLESRDARRPRAQAKDDRRNGRLEL